MSDPAQSEMRVSAENGLGRLRLDRPQAIHALTMPMCDVMIEALLRWREDSSIRAVLVDHAGGRGFCAGGDVRLLSESAKADGAAARAFWYREYQLNHLMFVYEKPIIAIMDGIVMGGGVGISQPASFRIATERTLYAMPETGIGLFPDVGGGWYLSRLPGGMGRYLATTGARIDGGDALALGIATHFIESASIETLKAAIIADPSDIGGILDRMHVAPPTGRLADARDIIDRTFAADRIEGIYAALKAEASPWAMMTIDTLNTRSPQAMKLALRELAESAAMSDFAEEMRMEYRLASRVLTRPDFAEGVRAVLIEKDNAPRWNPPTIDQTPESLIDGFFAPLPPGDEWTPLAAIGETHA